VRVFLDANVLVYLLDGDPPVERERAREVVSEVVRARSLVLSSQVLGELFATITRKLAQPVPAATALRALADLAAFPVVVVDATLAQRVAARSAAEQVSCWDALILESAVEAGAATVYSEDLQAGSAYAGVTLEDPFAG
jgi:predicted nucleic acid-binding protein